MAPASSKITRRPYPGYERLPIYSLQLGCIMSCLYSAGRGVKKNGKKARESFLEAAEQGYAEAQFMVGTLCSIGKDFPKDEARAMEWFL